MILFKGQILEDREQSQIIDRLAKECHKTLSEPGFLQREKVIEACDVLYHKVIGKEFDDLIVPLLEMLDLTYDRFLEMAHFFSKENLLYKCNIELGDDSYELEPLKNGTRRVRYPLGILFHIAAGNVDGLPAYSVIEGLLAGNINILKLPTGDSGLSIRLLSELIRIEPDLAEYIYVFDVPSTETATLKKFCDIADGVVVWGSDEAVAAAYSMAKTSTKVIPWGHKLSFAYVTQSYDDRKLKSLATHICRTNQLLCSSCQGIFFDTDDKDELELFGRKFFQLLKEAAKECHKQDKGMRGMNTIRLYCDKISKDSCKKIFNEEGVSVIIAPDKELELSYLFRNVWIKGLKRNEIITQIKKHKNHLQTCGLICGEDEKEELVQMLAGAGIVRITSSDMSRMFPGEAHDGVYPLQQYSRIVEID